jgi:hypothetical protein
MLFLLCAEAGDGLVVHDAGAYCMAMASTYNLKVGHSNGHTGRHCAMGFDDKMHCLWKHVYAPVLY